MSFLALARSTYHAGLSRLPLPTRRRILYTVSHLRPPCLVSPRGFNEKVNWRILYDRRSLVAWSCDKQKMKQHVAALDVDVYVPTTIWKGSDLSELAALDLPPRWVLKPNNASGVIYFGRGRDHPIDELKNATRGWLENRFPPKVYGEWAYFQAEKAFLVEEWVGDGEHVPTDYKFFVFDGQPRIIQVNRNRFGNRSEAFYSADWTPQACTNGWPRGESEERPARLDQMLQIASAIGAGFDFLRVDLYSTSRGVVFGEVTPYPAGGLEPFKPRRFDLELGAAWKLPRTVVDDGRCRAVSREHS